MMSIWIFVIKYGYLKEEVMGYYSVNNIKLQPARFDLGDTEILSPSPIITRRAHRVPGPPQNGDLSPQFLRKNADI